MRSAVTLRTAAATAAALLVAVLVPGAAAGDGAPPSDPPQGARPAAAAGSSATVTLITGDVIRLDTAADGSQHADIVRQADPREGIHIYSSGGHVHAEPASASPLLAGGALDPQLFDVTALVAQQLDDAHTDAIPLITTYSARPAGLAPQVPPAGSTKKLDLPAVNGAAVAAAKSRTRTFWTGLVGELAGGGQPRLRQGVQKIWLDAKIHATLDESVPMIGGPAAWARGLDGAGVTVAVLDTGIDAGHPDFAGRIGPSKDFTGTGSVADGAGHGTHVASILAGSGAASDGRYRGVAPGAELMIGKVLDDNGSGYESWAIQGMTWAAESGAGIVNMSLGGPVTKGEDPLSQAVDALTAEHGTLFVIAAGNASISQPGTKDVTSPGAARDALTVGAVSKRGFMWSGSRNGLMGDAYIKPDIVAPGQNITAARAAGTGFGDDPYTSMTGTSMAAPHVAGSAVLLREQHPDWSAAQLRAALTSTAKPIDGVDVFRAGAGLVDIDRATRQQVFADTGLLSMGYFAEPADPAKQVAAKQISYRNESADPVTLTLSSALADTHGNAAPDGVLTVSPATLTIAPGDSATATVTVDVRTAPAATYSGRVIATDGGDLQLDTAIGFYKQDDTVDVTFHALDRTGAPGIARLRVAPYQHADGRYYPDNIYLTSQQTEWTLRLPVGDYNVFGLITTYDASGRFIAEQSIVGDPKLEVRAPNFDVTLDARDARPVSLRTPKESAPRDLQLTWWRGDPENPIATYDYWGWSFVDGEPEKVSVAPTEAVTDAPFDLVTTWDAGVPLLTSELLGPGAQLDLDLQQQGGPQIDGTHTYRLADAGTGTAAELAAAAVRGAAALVQESPDADWQSQVEAAAAAGAAVVILYADRPGTFAPGVSSPAPVLALDQRQGEQLAALADRPDAPGLRLTGTPRTPYAYDLAFAEKQQIGPMNYRVTPAELAQVNTRIHTSGTGESGWRLHNGFIDACRCYAGTASDYVPATGYTRTEYVTAGAGIEELNAWQFSDHGWPGAVVWPRELVSHPAGSAPTTDDWLKAPYTPGVANTTFQPQGNTMVSDRWKDQIWYDIAGFTDSAGHWARQLSGMTTASRVYRDGTLIRSVSGRLNGQVSVPTAAATYRIEADADGDGSGLSTRTRTAWTFVSAGTDGHQVLPLIDVDYPDVADPRSGRSLLDLTNTSAHRLRAALQLKVTHQNGSTAPAVDTMTVDVSFDDGAHWQPATVRSTGDGGFTALYTHPRAGEFVSLRVHAADPDGNAIDQTVIRAYRLGGA